MLIVFLSGISLQLNTKVIFNVHVSIYSIQWTSSFPLQQRRSQFRIHDCPMYSRSFGLVNPTWYMEKRMILISYKHIYICLNVITHAHISTYYNLILHIMTYITTSPCSHLNSYNGTLYLIPWTLFVISHIHIHIRTNEHTYKYTSTSQPSNIQ